MSQQDNFDSKVFSTKAFSLIFALAWCLFVVASLSQFVIADEPFEPIYVNNNYIGNLYLNNLAGNRGLSNVRFGPANGDMNIINTYHLNWVQIAERGDRPGYPRVDPPNNVGQYGNHNDPFYHWPNERNDGHNGANAGINGNNWYMQDYPGIGNGINFETQLVTSENNNIRCLKTFNWSVQGNGGRPTGCSQPNFIHTNNKGYNWANCLNASRMGNYWTRTSANYVVPARVTGGTRLSDGIYRYGLQTNDIPVFVPYIRFWGSAPGTIGNVTPPYQPFWYVDYSMFPGAITFVPMDPANVLPVTDGFELINPNTLDGGTVDWQVDNFRENIPGPQLSRLSCPPGGAPEGEPVCHPDYVDMFNGGCDSSPPMFQPLNLGVPMCGTSGTFQRDGLDARDTDWFTLFVPSPMLLKWTVTAEFPVSAYIVGPGPSGCMDQIRYDYATGGVLQPVECAVSVPAGQYWLVVMPSQFTGVECGAAYVAMATTETAPPPPPQPANDFCSAASGPLGFATSPILGTTVSATLDTLPPGCPMSSAPGVWYTVMGTGRPITVSLCTGLTDYNSRLDVFCGPCENLHCVAMDVGSCAPASEVTFCTLPSQLYSILVSGDGTTTGNFGMMIFDEEDPCWDAMPCPAGCLPVSNLTILVGSSPGVLQLTFTAPQMGLYMLWMTMNHNNDGNPDHGMDPDWTLNGVQTLMPGMEFSWIVPDPGTNYCNFVITVDCFGDRGTAPIVPETRMKPATVVSPQKTPAATKSDRGAPLRQ